MKSKKIIDCPQCGVALKPQEITNYGLCPVCETVIDLDRWIEPVLNIPEPKQGYLFEMAGEGVKSE